MLLYYNESTTKIVNMPKIKITKKPNIRYQNSDFVNCKSKKRYISEQKATYEAESKMLQDQNLELSVYKCDFCLGWHLTRGKKLFK